MSYVIASYSNDCIVLRKHLRYFPECLFPGTGVLELLLVSQVIIVFVPPQRSIVIITMKRTSAPGITIPVVKLRRAALMVALQESLKVITFSLFPFLMLL